MRSGLLTSSTSWRGAAPGRSVTSTSARNSRAAPRCTGPVSNFTSKSFTVTLNGTRSASVNRAAGREVVVLGEVVGEALTHDHHAGAAETEQHADRHPDEHEDQADVEHQIAGLAQVATLCRHAVAV